MRIILSLFFATILSAPTSAGQAHIFSNARKVVGLIGRERAEYIVDVSSDTRIVLETTRSGEEKRIYFFDFLGGGHVKLTYSNNSWRVPLIWSVIGKVKDDKLVFNMKDRKLENPEQFELSYAITEGRHLGVHSYFQYKKFKTLADFRKELEIAMDEYLRIRTDKPEAEFRIKTREGYRELIHKWELHYQWQFDRDFVDAAHRETRRYLYHLTDVRRGRITLTFEFRINEITQSIEILEDDQQSIAYRTTSNYRRL